MSDKDTIHDDVSIIGVNITEDEAVKALHPEDDEGITALEASEAFNTIEQGYVLWEYAPGIKLRLYFPSAEVTGEANFIYSQMYRAYLKQGALPLQKLLDEAEEIGTWTEEDEKNFMEAEKVLRDKSIRYLELRQKILKAENSGQTKKLSKDIDKAEEEYKKAYERYTRYKATKETIVGLSADSMADEHRRAYYVYRLTRLEDGSPKWESFDEALKESDIVINKLWQQILKFYVKYGDRFLGSSPVPDTGKTENESAKN